MIKKWMPIRWRSYLAAALAAAILFSTWAMYSPSLSAAPNWTTGGGEADDPPSFDGVPVGMDIDPVNGFLFVADHINNKVNIYDKDGVSKGIIFSPDFSQPLAVRFDGPNYLYVTDRNKLFRFHILYWGTSYSFVQDVKWDGGLAYPQGIAISGSDLYVADTNNDRVLKFNTATFSSLSTPAIWSDDLDPDPAMTTALQSPTGLAADTSGVYISSQSAETIMKVTPSGSVERVINLDYPRGLRIGVDGYLYAASRNGSSLVTRLNKNLDVDATYFHNPTPGLASNDIALDQSGALYVSQESQIVPANNQVKKLTIGSPDNRLSALTISEGALVPFPFSSDILEYSAVVGGSVDSIAVTPVLANTSATVQVNHVAVTSGDASEDIPLATGDNYISVDVTAENNSVRAYTIKVTKARHTDAALSALSISSGPLNETFDPADTEYSANVANSIESIEVTGLNSYRATLTVNGNAATNGSAYGPVPLAVGPNPITIIVTAEDGMTTRTYNITVTRAPSADATLSSLTMSSGTLDIPFAPGTTSYTSSVANSVTSLSVTPTSASSTATVKVNGNSATSGNAFGPIPLPIGSSTITIVVTAQDGTTTKTYSVRVTRAGGVSVPAGNQPGPLIDLGDRWVDPDTIDTSKPTAVLNVTPKDGVAAARIPASVLTGFRGANASFLLEIKTPYGSYRIPVQLASLIPGLEALLAKHAMRLDEISFGITLTDRSGDSKLQQALEKGLPDGGVMGALVDFKLEILNTSTGEPLGVADTFSQALNRLIPMPRTLNALPEQWGAFRYNETTGVFEFVPAKMVQIEDVWYASISSYSNSVYVVADNKVSFTDLQQHWSQSMVELAAAKKLVEGVSKQTFVPDRAVTRAEFTAMLVRALGRGTSSSEPTSYDDVKQGDWYYSFVAKAKELGLLGFAKGDVFMPNQPLTREEMASMLAAAVKLEANSVTKGTISVDGYKDAEAMDPAHIEAIRLLIQLRIMTGTSEETFNPKGETTRAQAATVLIRTLQKLDIIEK
ncbi:hypothetical protein D3P09_11435 [Paenibacillus pinisoli]|uniref:SLH domain-containing protein n=1 Tax=Paenibacillus pinisoli TaxID=1276110 RepID=A0A3A6Q1Z0_9BACL|nr:cadherin-like beta sandwich domain-containing protein [Paenibacillus pinisoli]RJX39984.1 hypothetical protein D3P09_11435 [Paenibacillus pinisoli]